MKVKFTKQEFQALQAIDITLIANVRVHKIKKNKPDQELLEIELSETDADNLRDKCGEQLQIMGFDENYNLTAKGKVLDSLIDKLYTE